MAAERREDAVLSEIDRAAWFDLPAAHVKILESQRALLDRLVDERSFQDRHGGDGCDRRRGAS
jgi:predicted NUDIX family NTP pyrophosphohydrolase